MKLKTLNEYTSDIKSPRRQMSELAIKRLQEEFGEIESNAGVVCIPYFVKDNTLTSGFHTQRFDVVLNGKEFVVLARMYSPVTSQSLVYTVNYRIFPTFDDYLNKGR